MNSNQTKPTSIGLSNARLLELNIKRRRDFFIDPTSIYWWWNKCPVKVLLVTDGILDFGPGDFGLSTFVNILQNDAPSRVNFQLTLAHLRSTVSDAQVMKGAPGIVNSIKGFCFDEPTHFKADMYDEVWLFGYETNFHNATYAQRNTDRTRYPADRLGDSELLNLTAYMNRGGGLFATGDHGALGRGLCGSVPRARNMRYWNSFTLPGSTEDEVSMGGPKRNDTNRAGHDFGTQFSDQSDDIPQQLDLMLYSTRANILANARYPHPILCGTAGRIDVLPDHPHEGECRVPADVTLKNPGGSDEYPFETGGTTRIVPEVIAFSRVPAGNTADKAGSKQATIAHSFGAISAYDGHRAGTGRVICDATWHHFVNVNLIGVVEGGLFDQFDAVGGDQHLGEDASKHDGFLSSAAGRAFFDKIKNYYTNIGVWIAPPASQSCFNRRVLWQLLYVDRIMEAALADPNVPFERISADVFYAIGVHARDAFGRRASQCQTLQWLIQLSKRLIPEFVPLIDPWDPKTILQTKSEPPLPILDPAPVLNVAFGAALVALRQAFPYPPEKITENLEKAADEVLIKGAREGISIVIKQANAEWKLFSGALKLK